MSYEKPPPSNPYGYGASPPAYAPPGGDGQQPYGGQAQQPYGAGQPGVPNQQCGGPTSQPYAPAQSGAPPSAYGQPGAYGPSNPLPQKAGMPVAGGQPGVVHVQRPQQKSKGLFGSLRKEWDSAVNTFDKYTHSGVAVAEYFNPGNVVQLISRNSGRAVQIVQSSNGMLTVDANGIEGPNTFNALWTVAQCYNYTIQLHNNYNYMAIENGTSVLKHYAHPTVGGPETKLRAISVDGQFVYLECDYDEKFHVGFEKNGLLKSAIATGRDVSSQFAVRLIAGVPKKH